MIRPVREPAWLPRGSIPPLVATVLATSSTAVMMVRSLGTTDVHPRLSGNDVLLAQRHIFGLTVRADAPGRFRPVRQIPCRERVGRCCCVPCHRIDDYERTHRAHGPVLPIQ